MINGEMPDRAPMFDLLRNDAVIEHFSGKPLTLENAEHVVVEAYAPAIDATRSMRLPGRDETIILDDGRKQVNSRWTSWTAHKEYRDSEHYATVKRAELELSDPCNWNDDKQKRLEMWIAREREEDAEGRGAGSEGSVASVSRRER